MKKNTLKDSDVWQIDSHITFYTIFVTKQLMYGVLIEIKRVKARKEEKEKDKRQ